MRIELSAVSSIYPAAAQIIGEWTQHTIEWIDTASSYVQKAPQSYLALIGANLFFFEVAKLICRIVNVIFNQCQDNYDALPREAKNCRAFSLGVIFVATMTAANWAFCKVLRLPISPWKVGATSIVTCCIYLAFKTR